MPRFLRTCAGEDDVSCARQSADFEVMENIIEKVRKHGPPLREGFVQRVLNDL